MLSEQTIRGHVFWSGLAVHILLAMKWKFQPFHLKRFDETTSTSVPKRMVIHSSLGPRPQSFYRLKAPFIQFPIMIL